MRTWLTGAQPAPRGLLISGGPHHHGADLLIGAAAVEVSHGAARATLPWSGYTRNRRYGRDDSWSLAFWGAGPEGIGVDGPRALDPVRAATSTRHNRVLSWNVFNRFVYEHPVVPLWAGQFEWIWISTQWYEVSMLLQLLRDRSDLRPALLDSAVTGQLSADLARNPKLGAVGVAAPRHAAAVKQAMRSLGYDFRYGRPLPNDRREPTDVVVGKVMRRLESNPWHNVTVTPERAAATVRRYYADVEPWPFAALGV